MIKAIEVVAAFSAYLFTGASVYISLVEHPARMTLDTRSAAIQWAPSYKRATLMQASLAVLSLTSGVIAWVLSGDLGYLVAAVVIGLVVPFTVLIIMPVNKTLLAQGRDLSSEDTRKLLIRWGHLHWVRSVLSLLASVLYLWKSSGA